MKIERRDATPPHAMTFQQLGAYLGDHAATGKKATVVRRDMPFDLEGLYGKYGLILITVSAPLGVQVATSDIALRREQALTHFGKRFAGVREFRVGDPAFDDLVFVDASVPDETLARLFGSADVRREVVAAFERPWVSSLQISAAGTLFYELFPACLRTPNEVAALLEGAAAIRAHAIAIMGDAATRRDEQEGTYREIARVNPFALERPLPSRSLRVGLGAAYTGALAALAVAYAAARVLGMPPLERHTILDAGPSWIGFAAGLGAALLHFPVLRLLYRGRSNSLRVIARLQLGLLFALPFVGVPIANHLNVTMDEGASETVKGWVSRVDRKDPHNEARVGDDGSVPRGSGRIYENCGKVPSLGLYENRTGTFTIKPGWLGARWIAACRLE